MTRITAYLPLLRPGDPITRYDGPPVPGMIMPGWFFYDETWADVHGPYDTEALARTGLAKYIEEHLCEGC